MRRSRSPVLPLAVLIFVLPFALPAQHQGGHHGHGVHDSAPGAGTHVRAHLRFSAQRTPTASDSIKAAATERTLLAYLARYADVNAAEADGYVRFAPRVVTQPVFHYTSRRHALRNAFSFDASRPTSLLYRRGPAGALELVGAMYTAPARAGEDELDARVPLGIAQWHQHVDLCIPRGDRSRWLEQQDGVLRFGPAGSIATREECAAAGGRWLPRIFGWMVHANLEHTAHGPRISWEHAH